MKNPFTRAATAVAWTNNVGDRRYQPVILRPGPNGGTLGRWYDIHKEKVWLECRGNDPVLYRSCARAIRVAQRKLNRINRNTWRKV